MYHNNNKISHSSLICFLFFGWGSWVIMDILLLIKAIFNVSDQNLPDLSNLFSNEHSLIKFSHSLVYTNEAACLAHNPLREEMCFDLFLQSCRLFMMGKFLKLLQRGWPWSAGTGFCALWEGRCLWLYVCCAASHRVLKWRLWRNSWWGDEEKNRRVCQTSPAT